MKFATFDDDFDCDYLTMILMIYLMAMIRISCNHGHQVNH